jgi:PKD repeat protein
MIAASVLAVGALATTSNVSRHANADTAPTGGLPATVSADVLATEQIDGVAWAQVTVGNTVYVTGSFANARPSGVAVGGAGSVARGNLLAYDITTGNLITSFNHTLNAQGLAIAVSPDKSTLYVGGDFTKVDGATHNHLAAFNIATGALTATFTANLNASVKSVTATNATVYAGGSFSTANGVAHSRLAAYSKAGALLSWNPSASAMVSAIVVSPDQSRVVVGGQFATLDGDARLGLGAVDATTGADEPWASSNPIADYGSTSNVTSLSADATQVYTSGYYFTHGGNFEGRAGINPNTGAINWMNTCHGDSYATFPMGQVLYSASHEHECSDIGAFSQTTPGPIESLHHFVAAETTYPTGTLHPAIFTVGGGPTYYNFGGQPSGTQLNWYPTLAAGTYTGQSQAAWSVSGNATYISYGGEFPTVNGTKQQGLVRFALRSTAPNKVGPSVTASALTPTVISTSPGAAHIGWQAASDQDNSTLTYAVTRDSSTTAIYTTTLNSTFYNRPALVYVDKNLTPGSSHTYKVRVTDPLGNTVLSSASAAVTISSTAQDAYSAAVLADGAQTYWPLGETAGSALGHDYAGGADLTMGAHGTFGVPGPRAGTTAVSFQGDPTIPGSFVPPFTIIPPVYSTSTSGTAGTANPLATYSVEAWVKTTSTTGGEIVGDGLWSANDSQTADRVLYFDASGNINFGAYNNGPTNAGLKSALNSGGGGGAAYNDGAWHHVVGTIGAGGGALYVDGVKVAASATMVDTASWFGNWRVGGDSLAGWPSAPTNGYLAGTIADVAVYPTALSAAQVLLHFNGTTVASTPVASFTATCTLLSCAFDASGSSDTGGTITGYAWDFGDTTSGTGVSPTHVYTPGTYTVKLTVTDDKSDSAVSTKSVSPVASTPVSSFTATCTALSCAFDGSGSSDTGGTITGYTWDFGDTTSGTGVSPTHVYTAGTYTVKLTVTDDQSNSAFSTKSVSPNSGTSTPVASFTATCTNLSCVFTSTSTDSGGTITGYAWDFGDTTSGTGANPTHIYAAAGTYTVQLTVTDNLTNTASTTAPVSPTSGTTTQYATDTFNRTVASGLGTADLGGAWTTFGSASNLSVAPGAASFKLPAAASQIGAYLTGVSQTNTEVDTTFTTDKAATGTGGEYIYIEGRRVSTNNEYNARVRITSANTVAVEIAKLSGSATVVVIKAETVLSGVTYTPGMQLKVRFQVTGTSPTTLQLKVWPATSAEPSAWTLTTTDSTAGLQTAGAVGLTTYLSGSTTNAPTTVTFSTFNAQAAL